MDTNTTPGGTPQDDISIDGVEAGSASSKSSSSSDSAGKGTYDPLNRGRSLHRTDQHIGGVAGGLAEYLDIDPSLARIGTAAAILMTGPAAMAAYAAAWLVIPRADGTTIIGDDVKSTDEDVAA